MLQSVINFDLSMYLYNSRGFCDGMQQYGISPPFFSTPLIPIGIMLLSVALRSGILWNPPPPPP